MIPNNLQDSKPLPRHLQCNLNGNFKFREVIKASQWLVVIEGLPVQLFWNFQSRNE
jgi:hypothetical protein